MFELRKGNRLTGQVKVRIRYCDGNTHVADWKILYGYTYLVLTSVVRELF